jgi:hypothetical protein
LGTGEEGARDGENPTFDEPGGLSVANGKLYIADTNNHLIRVANLKTRRVETLVIRGLEKLTPPHYAMRTEQIELPEAAVAPDNSRLSLTVHLPTGYKLNPNAPSRVTIKAQGARIDGQTELTRNLTAPSLELPLTLTDSTATIEVHLLLYYCQSGREALCFIKEANLKQPLRADQSRSMLSLDYHLREESGR